jgi:hypothetical protein
MRSLNEKIKEDRSTRKMDRGQLSKWKKNVNECFGAPQGRWEKKERQAGEALKNTGQVDLGF